MFRISTGIVAFILSVLVTLPVAAGVWFSPTQQDACYQQGTASLHSDENAHYTVSLLAEEIVEFLKKGSRLASGSFLEKRNSSHKVQLSLIRHFKYPEVNLFTLHNDVYIQIRSLRL